MGRPSRWFMPNSEALRESRVMALGEARRVFQAAIWFSMWCATSGSSKAGSLMTDAKSSSTCGRRRAGALSPSRVYPQAACPLSAAPWSSRRSTMSGIVTVASSQACRTTFAMPSRFRGSASRGVGNTSSTEARACPGTWMNASSRPELSVLFSGVGKSQGWGSAMAGRLTRYPSGDSAAGSGMAGWLGRATHRRG